MADQTVDTGIARGRMAVERLLGGIARNQRIDLFGTEATERRIGERIDRQRNTIVGQHEVDRMIAGDIPASAHPMRPPREVPERAMHRLVREGELRIGKAQAVDERRVKPERP